MVADHPVPAAAVIDSSSSSSSDEDLNPFQSASRVPPKPSIVSLDDPLVPAIPDVGPEPPIVTMTAAPVQSNKYIADAIETGGETDVFSDGDTEVETDAEKAPTMEPMINTRKSSSSSSNSSWSSSDNEQNL